MENVFNISLRTKNGLSFKLYLQFANILDILETKLKYISALISIALIVVSF